MPRSERIRSESDIYHVVIRGNAQQLIFEDNRDRHMFLRHLRDYSQSEHVVIYAWCLMDNHVHLLLKADYELLPRLMKRVEVGYALSFNRKHGRTGHLFQGRYRSEPVEDDAYFLAALRYIHQNPEKAGLGSCQDYPWSSYREYLGIRGICDTALALEMLDGIDGFVALHDSFGDERCLEGEVHKVRTDSEAFAIAWDELGKNPAIALHGCDRVSRNVSLRRLRRRGLSVRQIARITGVGQSIVARAK